MAVIRLDDKKKRILIPLVSVLLTLATILIVFAKMGFVPFGDKLIYTWDLREQYSSFYVWYRDALLGKVDLQYGLIEGFGGATATFFAYYLASPLNIILLFFNRATMPIGVTILYVLKLMMMSASMSAFLYHKRPSYMAAICGLCYSLCGYVVAFGSNMMWLDAMILLPMVIWGLDEIIYSNRIIRYTISLGLLLLANFYTGYMVCIFVIVYAVITWMVYPRGKAVWRFIYGSVLAGMLSAILLLPAFWGLQGRGHSASIRWYVLGNFTRFYRYRDILWAFAPAHFRTVQRLEANGGSAPLLYIGLLPLLGICIMVFAKHISFKQKLGYLVLLAVLQVSMNHMNMFVVMHGMDNPQGAPWRFAFLWSFAGIMVGYEGLVFCENLFCKKRVVLRGTTILLTIFVIAEISWNMVDTWNQGYDFASANGYKHYITEASKYYTVHESDLANGRRTKTEIEPSWSQNDGYLWRVATVRGYTSTISAQNEKMMTDMAESREDFSEIPICEDVEIDARKMSHVNIDVSNLDKDKIVINVPYETSWTAKGDGKKLETGQTSDDFLQICGIQNVQKVELTYHTRGLGLGIIITVVSALLLAMECFKPDGNN